MPSERHLKLAELLAEGVEPTEACLQAGWPESTARWLGPVAHEFLAKAGISVADGGATAGDEPDPDAEPAEEQTPVTVEPFPEQPREAVVASLPEESAEEAPNDASDDEEDDSEPVFIGEEEPLSEPPDEPVEPDFDPDHYDTKAEAVRAYVELHPDAEPAEVADAVGCAESTARTNMR